MRTLDASVVNRIVNEDPDVAVSITHDPAQGPIDFSACCLDPDTYIVIDNGVDGAAIFEWSSPTIWQAHTIFAKSCRGADALYWAKEFIREMFEHWGATELWGQTPVDNRAAIAFNYKLGAKYAGERGHWKVGPVKCFRIRKDEWMAQNG